MEPVEVAFALFLVSRVLSTESAFFPLAFSRDFELRTILLGPPLFRLFDGLRTLASFCSIYLLAILGCSALVDCSLGLLSDDSLLFFPSTLFMYLSTRPWSVGFTALEPKPTDDLERVLVPIGGLVMPMLESDSFAHYLRSIFSICFFFSLASSLRTSYAALPVTASKVLGLSQPFVSCSSFCMSPRILWYSLSELTMSYPSALKSLTPKYRNSSPWS